MIVLSKCIKYNCISFIFLISHNIAYSESIEMIIWFCDDIPSQWPNFSGNYRAKGYGYYNAERPASQSKSRVENSGEGIGGESRI